MYKWSNSDVKFMRSGPDSGSVGKKGGKAPKAQNLYHMEYQLVPDDPSTTTRIDLVSYGTAAKLFTEKQEAKVIKTWIDNDQTWVAWSST